MKAIKTSTIKVISKDTLKSIKGGVTRKIGGCYYVNEAVSFCG